MKRLDHYWYSQNVIAWLLLPMSGMFCILSMLRRWLYVAGIFKPRKPSVPVIVIGNISVGGTGKTPLLINVCQYLISLGYKPGIVSRGYGGKSQTYPLCVDENTLAAEAGDEPVMIAQRTQCPVVVGPNRVADINVLLDTYACDVVLADDGMQHYRMHRDLEIAVVDGERRFGNGYCLPAGPLREPLRRLKSVDMVITNGGKDNQLSFQVQPRDLVKLNDRQCVQTLASLAGQRVHAVAGIGNPQRFFDTLHAHGIECITHEFPDHHVFKPTDFDFIDKLPVIMTEKDAVKCYPFRLNQAWYLTVDVSLSSLAQQRLSQLIAQVCHG